MASNPQPVIILVEPQMGENIGMCARAMLNCGLERLRLVRPRDGWPQESARATAADADRVLDGAEVFESLDQAIADCQRVFASTARGRSLPVPVLEAEEAAGEIVGSEAAGGTVAVLFGPEASGLDKEAISRADALLHFPTNPDFPSLNLAQAVLLLGWEWRRASETGEAVENEPPANRADLESLIGRFEESLEEAGFFLTPELKPHSVRTLRSLLTRTKASPKEVKFLQGMLTALFRKDD